jgi:hypothetical protein
VFRSELTKIKNTQAEACATQTFDVIGIFNPAKEITGLERVPPAKAAGDCGTLPIPV